MNEELPQPKIVEVPVILGQDDINKMVYLTYLKVTAIEELILKSMEASDGTVQAKV